MEKKYTIDEVEEEMLQYMKEKYDKDFKVESIGKPLFIGSSVEASLYLEDDEYKNIINIYWELKEDGSILIREDYTELLFKDEIIKYMDKKVQKTFGNFNYQTYSNLWIPPEIEKYDELISFNEYIRDGKMSIKTYVVLDETSLSRDSEIEQSILSLYEDLKKDGMENQQFFISVFIFENDMYASKNIMIDEYKNNNSLLLNVDGYPFEEYLVKYTFISNEEDAKVDKHEYR